jgi:hypothetical protein
MVIPLAAAMAAPSVSTAHAAPLWTLHGTVVNTDGKAVPKAGVGLAILPSGVLAKPTPTEYIAKVVSAPDGSFSIPAPSLSAATLDQAVHNDGWLNLELEAIPATPGFCNYIVGCVNDNPAPAEDSAIGYATYEGSYALSVLVTPSQVTGAPLGTVRSAPNDILLTVYNVQGQPVPPSTPCLDLSCLGAAQPASQCNYSNVSWQTVGNPENDWEPVGEIHTWDDMRGAFSYGETSSTDLGVAYDYGGGHWTASGSIHVGNSVSFQVGPIAVGPDTPLKVQAEFGWVKEQGTPPACAGQTTEYRIRATGWTGGLRPGPLVSGNDGPSKYYGVDPTYRADIFAPTADKNGGKNYKYTLDVSAFGVFTLSAETDYSSSVTDHWDFGSQAIKHSLFSYGAPPPDLNAQLVFASTEPLDPPSSVGAGPWWGAIRYQP